MAEVLVQFDPPLTDESGRTFVARICGRVADDGLWEGWIEFDPLDGGPALRTPRETEQPNRVDLEYWASGLTVAYLEGAIDRAMRPSTPDLRPHTMAAQPSFDRPAPPHSDRAGAAVPPPLPRAVLDPFDVYAQGEHVLRQELSALNEGHLQSIIRAYGLTSEPETGLRSMRRPELAELIIDEVRQRVG